MKKLLVLLIAFTLCALTACVKIDGNTSADDSSSSSADTQSVATTESSEDISFTADSEESTISAPDTEESSIKESSTEETSENENAVYTATIVVKDYGTITLELFPEVAPKTVANFVKLAEAGFYDGLTFHRIMHGFMIQGGDPNHNGTGGSDETVFGEFAANGFNNTLSHKRGVISMARKASPFDSATSQFFIMHQDNTYLDGYYAAFGIVTDGIEVVDAIAEAAEPIDENGTIPYEKQPVIEKVTVTKN